MNKKTYIIYLHRNKINNKVYIGQTSCKNPNDRWRNGTHYGNTYFGRAIKKYGWDNFEHIILEKDILTSEEADQKEKYYIKQYKSNISTFGYNSTSGGKKCNINKKASLTKSNFMKGKWKDKNFQNKMRKAMIEYWNQHPERKKELGQKIQCVETGKIFDSYKEAGVWCGLKNYKDGFLKYFRGERFSCGKHPDNGVALHWRKLDKNNIVIITNKANYIKQRKNTKKVQCIETQEIFNSLEDAIQWCGLSSTSSITNMINGRRKSAGKHPITKEFLHWKYI